ncbi:MAG: hypothetical protein AAFY98_03220 [Verrucomicrobiota bacterium]
MPQADKSDHDTLSHGKSEYEGKHFHFENPEERAQILREAFDYRGDVTLSFTDGSTIEGFVHNVNQAANTVTLFAKLSKRESENKEVSLDQITGLSFSGEDTAFGKSWDDWVTKSEAQRAREADRLRSQSIERGEL